MAAAPHILIVGAGIGGLTAALSLMRRGFRVDVFDQVSVLKELGAGIQIAPNGSRVLRELGLAETLRRVGIEANVIDLRIWDTGARSKMMEHGAKTLERYGSPHYTIHRADLQEALLKAVRAERSDAVHLEARCTGFTQSEKGVVLVLANGERVAGDALIGADGIHSVVRQTLFGPDKPEFTGFMAWRGLCPAATLPHELMRHGGWIGPASHIFHYPVRGGALMNMIGVVERADWKQESWTDRGTREECLADFPGWHEDAHTMIASCDALYKWALVVRQTLPCWSVGRATLLGDACHSTLPFLAQGASMSIEDGYVLARCLADSGDVEAALKRYEAARIERTTEIVLAAVAQTKRLHGDSLRRPDTAREHVEKEWSPDKMQALYDGIYGYDALNVAV